MKVKIGNLEITVENLDELDELVKRYGNASVESGVETPSKKLAEAHIGVIGASASDIARGVSRADGLQLLLSAQHPRDFSLDIRGEVTEWVCFHLELEEDLAVVHEFFPDVDMVRDFPPGKFVSYSPRTKSKVFGQLEPGWPPGRFVKA